MFGQLLSEKSGFSFDGRNRRPPRDGVNALLSFVYSILGKDISGALQGVGLGSAGGAFCTPTLRGATVWAGYFGRIPRMVGGQAGVVADNRGQIKPQDFVAEASGAVSLKADARKLLFQSLAAKKQEKIVHPFLDEEVEIGLLPYIQAMLLARHLRGDLAEYPPFLMR